MRRHFALDGLTIGVELGQLFVVQRNRSETSHSGADQPNPLIRVQVGRAVKPASERGGSRDRTEQAPPVARHRRRPLGHERSLPPGRAFPHELPRPQQADAMHGHDSRLPSRQKRQISGQPQDIETALVYETDRRYTLAALHGGLATEFPMRHPFIVERSSDKPLVAAGFGCRWSRMGFR